MSLPILFYHEVPEDINEAIDWYEKQEAGLGLEFFAALLDHLNFLAEHPKQYAVEYRNVRSAPMRRFPYVVYYRAKRKHLEVIAIIHGHRNPAIWRRRSRKPRRED